MVFRGKYSVARLTFESYKSVNMNDTFIIWVRVAWIICQALYRVSYFTAEVCHVEKGWGLNIRYAMSCQLTPFQRFIKSVGNKLTMLTYQETMTSQLFFVRHWDFIPKPLVLIIPDFSVTLYSWAILFPLCPFKGITYYKKDVLISGYIAHLHFFSICDQR